MSDDATTRATRINAAFDLADRALSQLVLEQTLAQEREKRHRAEAMKRAETWTDAIDVTPERVEYD